MACAPPTAGLIKSGVTVVKVWFSAHLKFISGFSCILDLIGSDA